MHCKICGVLMWLVGVYDNCGNIPEYAHDVHLCDSCGCVAIDRVWDALGITWIKSDGSIIEEKR
jgi:hypothetical protein